MGAPPHIYRGLADLDYNDHPTMSVKRDLDSSCMYKGSNPMYKPRLHRLRPMLKLSRPRFGTVQTHLACSKGFLHSLALSVTFSGFSRTVGRLPHILAH